MLLFVSVACGGGAAIPGAPAHETVNQRASHEKRTKAANRLNRGLPPDFLVGDALGEWSERVILLERYPQDYNITAGVEVFGAGVYHLICSENTSIVSTFGGFECPDCLLVLQFLCYLHQTAPLKER